MSASSPVPPPPPSNSPAAAPGPKNVLAVISLILALVAPAAALVNAALVAILARAAVVSAIFGALGRWTPPGSIAAIVVGHIALVRAKRYPRPQAWRGFAIAGLALGYVELAAYLGFIIYILATFQ